MSAERPCIGTQLGPCTETTLNDPPRCRDCDIEWFTEACRCEACGHLAMDLRPLGIDYYGLPHGELSCPDMAL